MNAEPPEPQTEALKRARAVLAPFFDSYVIVGRASRDDGKGDKIRYTTHGSFTDTRGCVEVLRDMMIRGIDSEETE